MNHYDYPEKQTFLCNYVDFDEVSCQEDDSIFHEAREMVFEYYNSLKSKYESRCPYVWCCFDDPIINLIKNEEAELPPNRILIKFRVSGRAFYMIKHFKSLKRFKTHPFKRSIPKRKRGKRYLKIHKKI